MQAAQGAEDRGHVAVRAGADDIEGLRKRGADGSGALQDRAGGQWERLESVRLRTLPPRRKDSRRRIAGGQLRLGTVATYMPTLYRYQNTIASILQHIT